jgi:hypothetical protein
MSEITILVAATEDRIDRYRQNLIAETDLRVKTVCAPQETLDLLHEDKTIDIFILDSEFHSEVHYFMGNVRQKFPRLLMIYVDEGADFGTRGHADDISTDPFQNSELVHKIKYLVSERRTETIQASSVPAIRDIYRRMRSATGAEGKRREATRACLDLGFEYAAFYRLEGESPVNLTLQTQEGIQGLKAVAPRNADPDDLMAWVAEHNETKIAKQADTINYRLVAKGRLGAAICTPVFFEHSHYGVLIACSERPDGISQDNIMLTELIAAQLASALSTESQL